MKPKFKIKPLDKKAKHLQPWLYRDPCGYTWRFDIFTSQLTKKDAIKYRVYRDGQPLYGTCWTSSLEEAMATAEWLVQHENDRYHNKLRESAHPIKARKTKKTSR